MAGNSQRRGAIRKTNKKGATAGSGGQRKRSLEGRGPTPKAEDRPKHKANRTAKKTTAKRPPQRRSVVAQRAKDNPEVVVGRNSIVEALRDGVPATQLRVADGLEADARVKEALRLAGVRGIPVMQVARIELDKLPVAAPHQGMALSVPPFKYSDLADLSKATGEATIVALDGLTDPRNLGAIARSAAAFSAAGLVIPERRAVGVTASGWKASAGALARLKVARVTNLTRALKSLQEDGWFIIGLAGESRVNIDELKTDFARGKVVVVIGSEGKGLSRLVAENCDVVVRIAMAASTESLNAAVAAGIALYEIDRVRRSK
jgi:23S rRNA (guanosine2251-2'-O)-methyltransferase